MDRTERFFTKLTGEPNSGCWLWMGTLNHKGYGEFYFSPEHGIVMAHRASWAIHNGPVPEGMCVLHRCDVRSCVNPTHLFLGTVADNNRDMMAKGRHVAHRPKGVSNGRAKITEAQALEIKRSQEPAPVISAQYGISQSMVSQIRSGHCWKHLPSD
jgi:hypothetical protein